MRRMNYSALEEKLQGLLQSRRRPVAITFTTTVPEGVAPFSGSEPSSCSYWRLASEGRTFYTTAADHQNCPIGGYTHNLLQPETMPLLNDTLNLMSQIGYIRMEEIPGVFQLKESPQAVVYAPLGDAPLEPSVVLASGTPGRVMMLAEAAARAGAMSSLPLLGRPTCMALPATLANGTVTSTGCVGNRVYTGLAEDELYVTLRGSDLERIAAEIDTIASANQALTSYHNERLATLRH
ncbi:MAG: DUF169 domain-containing protein [Candidatus Solibacter sp.]